MTTTAWQVGDRLRRTRPVLPAFSPAPVSGPGLVSGAVFFRPGARRSVAVMPFLDHRAGARPGALVREPQFE